MYNNEADDGLGLNHVVLWDKTWSDLCEEVKTIIKYTRFKIFNTGCHDIELKPFSFFKHIQSSNSTSNNYISINISPFLFWGKSFRTFM
jgi:hypothetical protein